MIVGYIYWPLFSLSSFSATKSAIHHFHGSIYLSISDLGAANETQYLLNTDIGNDAPLCEKKEQFQDMQNMSVEIWKVLIYMCTK